jgi:hypothetical protein
MKTPWLGGNRCGFCDTARAAKANEMRHLARGTRVAMRSGMTECLFAAIPSVLACALFVATLRLRGKR